MAPILGMLAAMLISLFTVAGFTTWAKMGISNIKTAATSSQLVIFNKAVQLYVQDYSNTLAGLATSTSPVTVTTANLQALGYLPAGFAGTNPFGQAWQAQVLQPTAGQLSTLVTSTGGAAISDPKQLVQIAAQAGAQGGYVPYAGMLGNAAMTTTTAVGAFGGWSLPLGAFANPGSGHLASLLAFSGTSTNNSYLYRFAVAGQPQLNAMQADLSMTDAGGSPHNISGANNISAAGNVTASGNVAASGNVTASGNVAASANVTASGNVIASGNITASGNLSAASGKFTTDANGRIGTGGTSPSYLPGGWGGGVSTWDVYAGGTVGVGSGGGIAASMNSAGEMSAGSGNFRVTSSGVVNLGAQGSSGGGCSVSSGSSALTSDSAGVLLACQGGVWRPVGGRQQKQAFYTATDGAVIPNPGCPNTATPQIILSPINIYIDATATASYTAGGGGPWTVYIRDGANAPIAGAVAQVETYCAFS